MKHDYNEELLEGYKMGLKVRHDRDILIDNDGKCEISALGQPFLLGVNTLDTENKKSH